MIGISLHLLGLGIGDWGLGIGNWELGIGKYSHKKDENRFNPNAPCPMPHAPFKANQSPVTAKILRKLPLADQIVRLENVHHWLFAWQFQNPLLPLGWWNF